MHRRRCLFLMVCSMACLCLAAFQRYLRPDDDQQRLRQRRRPQKDGARDGRVGDGNQPDRGSGDFAPADAASSCAADGACVAPAPNGWTGPLRLSQGAGPSPACPAALPQLALTAHADLMPAKPASCGCTCQASGSCQGAISKRGYSSAQCDTGTDCGSNEQLSPGCSATTGVTCSPSNPAPVVAWKISVGATYQGTCTPQGTKALPELPAWRTAVQACGSLSLSSAGCTGGSVCLPAATAPYDVAGACVLRAGEHPCPGAPYTSRRVVYGGVDDQRDCSTCSCTGPTGSCGGFISFRSGANCAGTELLHAGIPGCVAKPAAATSLSLSLSSASVTCGASGGTPTGSVEPTDPTTLCCTRLASPDLGPPPGLDAGTADASSSNGP